MSAQGKKAASECEISCESDDRVSKPLTDSEWHSHSWL
jgi:hypothetical protein